MVFVKLNSNERAALQDAIKHARDAHIVKRAQALLWLDDGDRVALVAQRLQVTRQTIYNWRRTFQTRSALPLLDRLRDQAPKGRPPTKRKAVQSVIQQLWQHSRVTAGQQDHVPRNAPAIQRYLARQGVQVHERTIRRTLRALGYRYKRPRYVLARRSPTWRQAKGG
jgi:transposase